MKGSDLSKGGLGLRSPGHQGSGTQRSLGTGFCLKGVESKKPEQGSGDEAQIHIQFSWGP